MMMQQKKQGLIFPVNISAKHNSRCIKLELSLGFGRREVPSA